MKKSTLIFALFTALLTVVVVPVQASVSVESTIGDNIYIIYTFKNLDPKTYNETIANTQSFNSTTITQIIVENQEKQDLTKVYYFSLPNEYDNATNTISASFFLWGSDIISYTIDKATMRRTYQVKTQWRKFQLNLTSSFSINFTQHFAEPVENWQKTDYNDTEGNKHPAYYYQSQDVDFLDELSFYFILPASATNVQATADIITFEVPPYFLDVFISSPFFILAVLVIIIIVVLIYRRVR